MKGNEMFSSLKVPTTPGHIGYSLSSLLLTQLDTQSLSNLDSPSLVAWAFQEIGMFVPKEISNLAEVGKEVDKDILLEGDLLFFKLNSEEVDHVGIYVGHNEFIHIPKAGEAICKESVNSYKVEMARRVTINEVVKYVLERMYIDTVNQSNFVTYAVEGGYKNDDYGFLRFYTQDVEEKQLILSESESGKYDYGTKLKNSNVPLNAVQSGIIDRSKNDKRPYVKKTSVEFITIHDTGINKFNASQWNEEVTTSSRPVSWHFTIDDKETYQHVPLDEIARHAGDGLTVGFSLTDTGVKYTKEQPELSFNTEDHYLYINGIKTSFVAPKYEDTDEYCHDITPAGLYTEIGENGNYWINAYYANKVFKKVSNRGGNRNSIGIETCIFDGVTYSKVMRRAANLVAHLLNIYHLTPRRVLQHRNFSGKPCPQSMIRAKKDTPFEYKQFMELVDIEFLIVKYLPEVQFTYLSHNPDILSNEGYLLKYVTEPTEVSYDVTVEYSGQIITKTYKTLIKPKEE